MYSFYQASTAPLAIWNIRIRKVDAGETFTYIYVPGRSAKFWQCICSFRNDGNLTELVRTSIKHLSLLNADLYTFVSSLHNTYIIEF